MDDGVSEGPVNEAPSVSRTASEPAGEEALSPVNPPLTTPGGSKGRGRAQKGPGTGSVLRDGHSRRGHPHEMIGAPPGWGIGPSCRLSDHEMIWESPLPFFSVASRLADLKDPRETDP